MKKHTKTVLSIAALGTACIVCLLLHFYFLTTPYTKVINKNWNIELPDHGAKEIYSYSEPSPHGDGIRYHVIDYPVWNDRSAKAQNAAWQLERIFYQSYKPEENRSRISRVCDLLKETDIKEDVMPNWERCGLIYLKKDDNSELFLFYLSETGTLYAVESFL